MREVLRLMWDYRAKWKVIGTVLGVRADKLDVIDSSNENVDECLCEMIQHWLSDTQSKPTQGAITTALQSEHVSCVAGSCLLYLATLMYDA